jgi:hypothetical protein
LFHPGKVLRVFRATDKEIISSDSSTQALVQMWDENIVTVAIKNEIGDKVKESDIVLIDYAPSSPNIPVPKQVAVKILRGEIAKKTWKEYEEFNASRKRERESQEFSGPQFTNVR